MKDTLFNLVQKLLKLHNIAFDKEELTFQIQSHPSYPSLHSITGVLDHFNIENIAAEVPTDITTLEQLPNCFLAQIHTNKGLELVVLNRKNNDYFIFDTANKTAKLTPSEFLQKFTGVIVAVEKTENEIAVKTYPNYFKVLSLIALVLISGSLIYQNSPTWHATIYTVLSIVGIVISLAIVKQEFGLQTTIGNAFCSGVDDKKDCDAVLTSKGAEIIKGYKLSDLSLMYFGGLTLLSLVQINIPTIPYLISLTALPITLYSIYYQFAVVKKWCLLCLSIVAVLWLQAVLPILTASINVNTLTTTTILISALVIIGTWVIWSYIKPLFSELNELKNERIAYIKFKRNFTLFKTLLQKSPELNTYIGGHEDIIFGHHNSNLELTIITNPFCGHCKPVHEHIHDILKRYQNDVKIRIRFNINTKETDSNAVKITTRLVELYQTKGENNCLNAMDDIYRNQDPETWLKKWGTCQNIEHYKNNLEKEGLWCKDNAINFTPEILINGKAYPKEYDRTDLILFIEDLKESLVLEPS